jgi:hypothetical protein
MYRFDTLKDANDFAIRFAGKLSFGAYNSLISEYDDGFFATNSLVLVYITSSSGSIRFTVSDVMHEGECFKVEVKQANNVEIGTCDMAGWFAIIEVPDKILNNCTVFDANFSKRDILNDFKVNK